MKWYYIVFGNGFVEYKESDDKQDVIHWANELAEEHETWIQSVWMQDEDGEYTIEVY